jgi:hypothetical protein
MGDATRKEGTKVYYRLAGADVADLWSRLRGVAVPRLTPTAADMSGLVEAVR